MAEIEPVAWRYHRSTTGLGSVSSTTWYLSHSAISPDGRIRACVKGSAEPLYPASALAAARAEGAATALAKRHHEGIWEINPDTGECQCECPRCYVDRQCRCLDCTDDCHDHSARPAAGTSDAGTSEVNMTDSWG